MGNWKWIVGALAGVLWLAPGAGFAAQEETQGQGSAATSGESGGATTGGEMGKPGATQPGAKAGQKQLTNVEIRDLSKLHAVNQDEIAAGSWMKEHATNDKVKSFASKMVDDHTSLDKDLTDYATKQGAELTSVSRLPGEQREARELQQLKTMSGMQADRRYMTTQVQGHRQALNVARTSERAAKKSGNKELASLFGKAAKKIDSHLKDAVKIEKELTQRQARTPKR